MGKKEIQIHHPKTRHQRLDSTDVVLLPMALSHTNTTTLTSIPTITIPLTHLHPYTKTRDPPDKDGRRMRKLPNGIPHSEVTQSHSVSHSKERSISSHRLRRLDRGNQNENTTMETDQSGTGKAHDADYGHAIEDNLKIAKGHLGIDDRNLLPNHITTHMDLLIWNCRDAGNKKFKRSLRELVQIHKPDMLVLMKTMVELASMGMFFNQMEFTTSAHVDPIGRSGGIWMI
ncbi:hypothetical protein LOK49_LG15G02533 [Camellia lanceoleosa]|uniref:Uncharacterized protein n=1 Tax=Camellia lanceoleosa TaxID=1840588 RepID=A0ACC0F5V3_9ERIC|nr:hypothetical protein LOK49_LG15G02533 [Camellia lanceoleosa]